MKLYGELAAWWPLLTPPGTLRDEARLYAGFFAQVLGAPPGSILELGAGSGVLAGHLDGDVVLLDISEEMLAQARRLNPGRQHVLSDMRTARLGRTFDAVLLHDAVMYLVSDEDLDAALATAALHCRPGGALLLVPDVVAETFHEHAVTGGGRGDDGRALTMTEWHWDPVADDGASRVDFAVLLREADGSVRCVHEQHTLALRTRRAWWEAVVRAGFEPVPAEVPRGRDIGEIFLARRPSPP